MEALPSCTESIWLRHAPHIMVLGDSDSHEQWLRARASRLTASQAAAALGQSKWLTPEQLLEEKRGETARSQPGKSAWFGSARERLNVAILGELTGLRVLHNTLALANAIDDSLACTPDGILVPDPDLSSPPDWAEGWVDYHEYTAREALAAAKEQGCIPFDVKNVRAKNGYFWRDGPPKEYELQMQCDLAVLGLEVGWVVAFIDSDQVHVHVVHRDPIVGECIYDAAHKLRRDLRQTRG